MNKMNLSIVFLASFLLTSGCASFRKAETPADIPETYHDKNILEMKNYINDISNLIEDEKVAEARNLCDKAIIRLFQLKESLGKTDYERFHGEVAVLRIRANHLGESKTAVVESDLFPLVWNTRVEKWLNYYTGRGRDHFKRWINRSKKYIDHIKKRLNEEGLPEDLSYVPVIESGYNPFARSRVNAMGLWQFMQATGEHFGLAVNYWIDERRDPYKSTEAAIQFLSELYEEFDCWHLALAAYNYGPTAVNRRIRRWNTNDFWALYLPSETEDFIPKIMAAIFIVREPQLFGFNSIYAESYEWKEFEVNDAMDLRKVAEYSERSTEEIHMLNPELRQMVTPPGDKYSIRLPAETYDRFVKNYTEAPESERYLSKNEIDRMLRRVVRHRVRRGENIWNISRRYNVSMAEIKEWNNLSTSTIQPGQELKIYKSGS